MNERFPENVQSMRTIVKRGDLGKVYHARAFWRRRAGAPKFGTWFGDKKQAGGGCLLDIGVHLLDLCLFSIDNFEPVSATGAVYTKFGNRGLGEGGWGHSDRKKGKPVFTVDDFATALIKFKNGATVDLTVSWVLHQAMPDQMDVELFGTEGGATIYPPRLYRSGKGDGEYEIIEPQGVKIDRPHCCRHADWIDGILKRRKPICTLEQAVVIQKILDAIYKSSETGKEVRIR
jgi:predicted dehydrogenase